MACVPATDAQEQKRWAGPPPDLRRNMEQQPIPVRYTYKTKEDFLHWLRAKKALQNQAADDAAQPDHPERQAAMVWADDGGRTSEPTEEAPPRAGD